MHQLWKEADEAKNAPTKSQEAVKEEIKGLKGEVNEVKEALTTCKLDRDYYQEVA